MASIAAESVKRSAKKLSGQQKLRRAVDKAIVSLQEFTRSRSDIDGNPNTGCSNNSISNGASSSSAPSLAPCATSKQWFAELQVGQKKPFKNPHDYNAVLHELAARRDAPSAVLWLRLLQDSEKLKPDIHSYTSCINALGETGRYPQALNCFEDMKANRLEPNLVALNAVLKAMAKAKKPPDAQVVTNFLHGMKRDHRVEPDFVSFRFYKLCLAKIERGTGDGDNL